MKCFSFLYSAAQNNNQESAFFPMSVQLSYKSRPNTILLYPLTLAHSYVHNPLRQRAHSILFSSLKLSPIIFIFTQVTLGLLFPSPSQLHSPQHSSLSYTTITTTTITATTPPLTTTIPHHHLLYCPIYHQHP